MPIGLLMMVRTVLSVAQTVSSLTNDQGWTGQAQVHWIGPQFGYLLALLGLQMAFNSIQNL